MKANKHPRHSRPPPWKILITFTLSLPVLLLQRQPRHSSKCCWLTSIQGMMQAFPLGHQRAQMPASIVTWTLVVGDGGRWWNTHSNHAHRNKSLSLVPKASLLIYLHSPTTDSAPSQTRAIFLVLILTMPDTEPALTNAGEGMCSHSLFEHSLLVSGPRHIRWSWMWVVNLFKAIPSGTWRTTNYSTSYVFIILYQNVSGTAP